MKKISCLGLLYSIIFILFFTSCNPTSDPKLLSVLTTTEVTSITQTTALSGGNVTSDGGTSVTARGVCWSTKANPTIADSKTTDGAGIGSYTSSLTGLVAGTTYFVRAYATTSAGTGYGGAYQFTTTPPTVSDIDGNLYHTVIIGSQIWMVENLKTTKYNDGSSITLVSDNSAWTPPGTPYYCWYNFNSTYKATYGALYTWAVVISGKLAPKGWHVPTNAEWSTLTDYVSTHLGTSGSTGKALAATTNWAASTNVGAIGNDLSKNNSSGFSALPGGYRIGTFVVLGSDGSWWSSTEGDTFGGWCLDMANSLSGAGLVPYDKTDGHSVRCIKD